jgi:uncharacterized protein (DUF488 family)
MTVVLWAVTTAQTRAEDKRMPRRRVFTIGHSTRPFEEFIWLLKKNGVKVLADVRRFPGSGRYPHFSKDSLELAVPRVDIDYIHFEDLGGRRAVIKNSPNTTWKNNAFRGYADYMMTPAFQKAVEHLEEIAAEKPLAYMCSEAVWWRCHRSLISDYLKANGWEVLHILDDKPPREHPYTKAANLVEGKLTYGGTGLFT